MTHTADNTDRQEPTMPTQTQPIPKGFGRRNVHCSNCGDERGGMFGHEISECRWRSDMTVSQVAALLPEHRRDEFLDLSIDRYFAAQESSSVGGTTTSSEEQH